MKRIGILTFWGVPNYGAYAQAYALNRIVSSIKTDYSVEHIAYLHKMHHKLYYKTKDKPSILRWWDIMNPKFYKRLWCYYKHPDNITYPNFERDWNSIPHVNVKSERMLEKKKWDIIITGSDCIWEYSIPDFGDDVHLIGNNMKCNRLIAYACSFGDMNPEDNFPDFVVSGLKKYNSISVRDKTSQIIACNQGDFQEKEIQMVLDPTLLYDFKNDDRIPVINRNPYILVYGYQFFDNTETEIKEYAKEHNLQILGAGLSPAWCDISLNDISPLEWIGLFKNAELVVTSTFHGLMFSINYNKRILFNQVEYVKNRSAWLLEKLGLSELFQNGVTLHNVLMHNWDYDSINKKLDEMRKPSMDFLERNLK